MIYIPGVKVTKYLQSGFRFDLDNGKVIYIDPFKFPDNQPQADIIFITHSHFDHLDEDSINKIRKQETQIVCTGDCVEVLTGEDYSGEFTVVEPNQKNMVEGVSFHTMPAYNIDKEFHPKGNGWVGYILEFGESTIYHLGDTDNIPEFSNLPVERITLALVPISGTYVMNVPEAVEAVRVIKPENVIPIHYDAGIVGSPQQAEDFTEQLGEVVEVMEAVG